MAGAAVRVNAAAMVAVLVYSLDSRDMVRTLRE
jgi:hypothetical protein